MSRSWFARSSYAAGALLGAAVLAACGGSGSGSGGYGGQASPEPSSASAGAAGALATRDVEGIGTTLVDASGKTLYTSDQEADGTVRCTGDCLGFWTPVKAAGSTAPSGPVTGLGVVRRSDGGEQLTFHGKPLYSFTLDAGAGQHKGDGLTDSFGGMSFTWHAATTTAAAPSSPASSSSGGGQSGGY